MLACCVCYQVELITRSEESYRLCVLVVCDHEILVDEEVMARAECRARVKKRRLFICLYYMEVNIRNVVNDDGECGRK
jgi:hypothetical protein